MAQKMATLELKRKEQRYREMTSPHIQPSVQSQSQLDFQYQQHYLVHQQHMLQQQAQHQALLLQGLPVGQQIYTHPFYPQTDPQLQADLLIHGQAQHALVLAQLQASDPYFAQQYRDASFQQPKLQAGIRRTPGNYQDDRSSFENTSYSSQIPTPTSKPVFEQVSPAPLISPSNAARATPTQDTRWSTFKSPPARPFSPSRSTSTSSPGPYTSSPVPTSVRQDALKTLGQGCPSGINASSRTWSAPSVKPNVELPMPRAASHAGTYRVYAVRQPVGPPGGAEELGAKNFQSR